MTEVGIPQDYGPYQIPPVGSQALQEPWIDPTTAFAGGFGANILRRGVISALRSAIAASIADYPIGLATAGAEKISPKLAFPVNLGLGMLSGSTLERGVEGLIGGGKSAFAHSSPFVPLQNQIGAVGDIKNIVQRGTIKGKDIAFTESGKIDTGVTGANLPTIPEGYVRLYRAESPTIKFDDIFNPDEGWFDMPQNKAGKFYTDDIQWANYYLDAYNEKGDAVIKYIDMPRNVADKIHFRGSEYIVGNGLLDD
jgi:hypothetical protein